MNAEYFIPYIAGITAGMGFWLLIVFGMGLIIISTFVDNPKDVKRFISIGMFVASIILYLGILGGNPVLSDFDEYYIFSVIVGIYWGCLFVWGVTKLGVFLGIRIEKWFDKNVIPALKTKAGYEDKKRFARFVVKPYKTPFGERGGYNISGYVARETRIYWYIDTETRGLVKIRKKYIGKDRYPVESIEVTNAVLSS